MLNSRGEHAARVHQAAWAGATPAYAADADGQKIFLTRCSSCHQANGQGVTGTFPPLAGNEFVSGDKGGVIRVLLNGLMGEVDVKGVTYSGVMPPWGTALKDDEIAAVLTYVRSSFGNKGSAVTTEDVAKVREATKDRKQPWTAEELADKANQGVPGTK
ncbi:MAG TPA: cytochrome c [Rhodothermales bacterium]|nr:cytochrome c [Rhodothermales bacterium]